jgi:hypothetical protein
VEVRVDPTGPSTGFYRTTNGKVDGGFAPGVERNPRACVRPTFTLREFKR